MLRRLQSSWAALRNVHDRVRSRPCRIRHTGRKLARSQPPACLWRCLFPGGSKICLYGRDGRRKAATMTPPLRLCIGSFFTSPVHGLLRGCSRSGPKRSHNVSIGTGGRVYAGCTHLRPPFISNAARLLPDPKADTGSMPCFSLVISPASVTRWFSQTAFTSP